jgi:predicted ester cyclase
MTHSGTHKGEFMGIPPTGKRVSIEETFFFRIAAGKIAE